jgi:hypothetical protein
MQFYIGLHIPAHARRFKHSFISVNRLRNRKGDFKVNRWILDSGAFTELSAHGHFRFSPDEYAEQVQRWSRCGSMLAAVSQDYMCEPAVRARTSLTIAEHQRLTIERYRSLRKLCPTTYIMPVLQGWTPADYVAHLHQYGLLLGFRAWVGVGSVCRRNGNPAAIEEILTAIHSIRPDLRLHGFGLKLTALSSPSVRQRLHSSDSMAWSWYARWQGRSPNSPLEAKRYLRKVQERLRGGRVAARPSRNRSRVEPQRLSEPATWI